MNNLNCVQTRGYKKNIITLVISYWKKIWMHQYSYSDLKLEKMTNAHGQNILSGYKVLIIFHYLQKMPRQALCIF